MKQPNGSISEFMILSTAARNSQFSSAQQFSTEDDEKLYCRQCQQNLSKLTDLRKRQIELEYQNAKINERLEQVQKDKIYLTKKLQELENTKEEKNLKYETNFMENIIDDLQAQLFEAKFINQLVILNKYHSDESLSQKYEQIVIDNLRLQEQLTMKDKIIKQKQFYPLYHFNSRIKYLRDNLIYWHKIATKECKQIKKSLTETRKDAEKMIDEAQQEVAKHICGFIRTQKLQIRKQKISNSFINKSISSQIKMEKSSKRKEKIKKKTNFKDRLSCDRKCGKQNCSSNIQ